MSLRIISGERRGAKIEAPEGLETRPLRDRIREALMSMLRTELLDAVVLDCFAGSGAVGLEAVSNGATHATLVDASPAACAVIRRNVEKLRFGPRTVLLEGEAPGVLHRNPPPRPYHLLFLMPPYHSKLCDAVLTDDTVLRQCAPGATAICEIHRDEPLPEAPRWRKLRERDYGITRLLFVQLD